MFYSSFVQHGRTYSIAPPRAYRAPVLNPLCASSSLECEWENPTITAPPTLRRMGGKEMERGRGKGEERERRGRGEGEERERGGRGEGEGRERWRKRGGEREREKEREKGDRERGREGRRQKEGGKREGQKGGREKIRGGEGGLTKRNFLPRNKETGRQRLDTYKHYC